ncbi:MAG: hypothetical protein P4N59_13085 [Negativicutes bacterium]|nr:hypothetical protein [Negativicutes bacterium]
MAIQGNIQSASLTGNTGVTSFKTGIVNSGPWFRGFATNWGLAGAGANGAQVDSVSLTTGAVELSAQNANLGGNPLGS